MLIEALTRSSKDTSVGGRGRPRVGPHRMLGALRACAALVAQLSETMEVRFRHR
jgi:hypothetical protein